MREGKAEAHGGGEQRRVIQRMGREHDGGMGVGGRRG